MSLFDLGVMLLLLLVVGSNVYLFLTVVTVQRQVKRLSSEQSADATALLLRRIEEIESEWKRAREEWARELVRFEQRFRDLSQDSVSVPSTEATELKGLADSRDEIPTLRQIERTRARLHSELHVDLRTLLRDQLA